MSTNHPIYLDEIGKYISALFAKDDNVEFRALRDGRGGAHCTYRQADSIVGDEVLHSWLLSHNQQGWSLYVGPNPRQALRGGGKDGAGLDTDVATYRCCFADFDDADPREALERIERAGIVPPTMLITSGRPTGAHAYWSVSTPIDDSDEWRGIQNGLIKAVNSDRAIKNPSRIMRLPGSHNHKWDAPCRILRIGNRYAGWDELGINPVDYTSIDQIPEVDRSAIVPKQSNLNRRTLMFLQQPCGEGDRNNALFAAASDYNGNNFSMDQAVQDLVIERAVNRDGLGMQEAMSVVTSAYSRQAQPSHYRIVGSEVASMAELERALNDVDISGEPESVPDGSQDLRPAVTRPEPESPSEEASRADRRTIDPRDRPIVSNVDPRVVINNGRRAVVSLYKPIDQIAREVQESLGGFPRRSKATGLFACKETKRGEVEIWSVTKPDELFALLHDRANVRWATGECESDLGDSLSTVTKAEFFKWLKDNAEPSYDGVSELPHVPEMPGMFYVPLKLPKPTGECLNRFINAFNPATDVDRHLMLAALLTPGWGGPPGTRPLFVFASDYGQGAGKTATAKAIGSVWGGSAPLDYEDNWQNIAKRIMSSEDWLSRVYLFDNVKGKFGGAAIEAAVTSEWLAGHKMFVGTVKRPNDATFFITFNMPEMSRDLAQRSVIIKLGPPSTGDFVEWASNYIRDNRLQLISDLLDLLKQPVTKPIDSANMDRWQLWQREVLSKVPGADPNDLAAEIVSRRPVADADAEEAFDIVKVISQYLVDLNRRELPMSEVTGAEIVKVMESTGNWTPNDSFSEASNSRKCLSVVRNKLLGRGVLMPLEVVSASGKKRPKKVRVDNEGRPTQSRSQHQSLVYGWVWDKANEVTDLPVEETIPNDLPI